MKRCPACQRTYAEDTMTFCLDDGTPLLSAEPGSFEAPPTLQIPAPRLTNQPAQPFPPAAYNQPSGTGFKLSNRILGMSGAVLLLLGTLMPIISILGLLNFSLFTFIQGVPTGPGAMPGATGVLTLLRIVGIVILLLGAGSLVLAWKNQLKALIATGIITLGILVVIFIKLQSLFSDVPAEFRAAVGIGWGFFAMVIAAILLIIAGVKKDKKQTFGTDWNSNPPPMNYS